jgi:hypothetical protein
VDPPDPQKRRYRAPDADSERWEGFEFRQGDIIINAPSKSGTTWTQLLVALLIFDGPHFPKPLGQLSTWMEQKIRSADESHAIYASQDHRRFIKSHSPLDGVPARSEVSYVCVGRDPRDAAVSMLHHSENMRRERFAELIGDQENQDLPPPPRPPMSDEAYFDRWIDHDDPENEWSVRFMVHHYTTFWERRGDPNVALFHFADYLADLPGELIRLAGHLGIDLDPTNAVELANEASLAKARRRAPYVAPEAHLDVWKDPAAFFRSGSRGEWQERMTESQRVRYADLMEELASPELAQWVHHGRLG